MNLLKKVFGGKDAEPVVLLVKDVLNGADALLPTNAQLVLDAVAAAKLRRGKRLLLDWTGVGAISSAFANALFLGLAAIRPIDEWRDLLEVERATELQLQILSKSLNAVRHSPTR